MSKQATHTYVVVSHTHWDREWYRPFEGFRVRLVRLLDKLLGLLDRDPQYRHFVLDGRTIVLADYLGVRPKRRADIERLVRAGRLLIGPHYVLPDEFLIGGESWVRNLQIGIRSAREFGPVMMVGYSPDAFGHIAHLPAILRGFGIDCVVLWRGGGRGATRRQRAGDSFLRLEGEFRSSERSHVLAGVLSARMWIKQRYQECEDLLARYAEPPAAWAHLLRAQNGDEVVGRGVSDQALLRQAWKL